MSAAPQPAEGAAPTRSCGSCSLCCKVMAITALDKPAGAWCGHCRPGREGCTIYPTRPEECRTFTCLYLLDARLGEEWRPSNSKIVLVTEMDGDRIVAHVDPQRPDAWRLDPYYRDLKKWARMSLPFRGQVMVCVGRRAFMIYPDRDVDLGICGLDEVIIVNERQTPTGVEFEPLKVSRDDPRARRFAPRAD